ncbi:MAG: CBS domain-containing protein [Bacteroidota bacterium]
MYNPSIAEIMSIDPISVHPNDTMDKVDGIFRTNSFRHLPVTDDSGTVIGIISKSDYLTLCNRWTLFLKDKQRTQNLRFFRSLLVKEVMTTPVVKLRSDRKVSAAVGVFKENLFHALPIVNSNDKLIGILTPLDLINYAYNEFSVPAQQPHHSTAV